MRISATRPSTDARNVRASSRRSSWWPSCTCAPLGTRCCRWPMYEELDEVTLDRGHERSRLGAAVELVAGLHDGAEWVPVELAEIARWFEAWRPVLDEKNHQS